MSRGALLLTGAACLALLALAVVLLREEGEGGHDAARAPATEAAREDAAPDLPEPLASLPAPSPAPAEAEALAVPDTAPSPTPPPAYLRALGGLRGRVLAADGAPAAGLELVVVGGGEGLATPAPFAPSGDAFAETRWILGRTRTGSDGVFLVEGLETRVHGALLLDPGGPRATLRLLETTPASGTVHDLGDIVLTATTTLTGRVVDERGHAVPGARVRTADAALPLFAGPLAALADWRAGGLLGSGRPRQSRLTWPPPEADALLPLPTTLTDAGGRFSLPAAPGALTLCVDHPRHPALVQAVDVPPGKGPVDLGSLVLATGATAAGSVVDAVGRPVAGARVFVGTLGDGKGPVAYRPPVTTDAQGRFAVDGLVPTPARALVQRAPGMGLHVGQPFVPGSEPTLVELADQQPLVLEISAEDGVPLVGLVVRGYPSDDDGDNPVLMATPACDYTDRLEPVGDGRFRLDLGPADFVTLDVSATGCVTEHRIVPLVFRPWADDSRRFVLRRGSEATVIVVRESDGAPVEWALVTVLEGAGERQHPLAQTRTGPTGLASFPALPAVPLDVEVAHPGFAVGSVGRALLSAGACVVRLVPAGSIEGVVRAPRVSLPALVAVRPGKHPSPRTDRNLLAATDEQGRFRVDGVQPGTCSVEVHPPLIPRNLLMPGASFLRSAPWASATADVVAGETSRVELTVADESSPSIAGTLWLDGQPARGLYVTCVVSDGGGGSSLGPRGLVQRRQPTPVGEDGAFDLGPLTGDDALLIAARPADHTAPQFVREVTRAELLAGPIRWELLLAEARGRVVDDGTGEPVGGLALRLRSADGFQPSDLWCRTDDQGAFVFDEVPEGTYSVLSEAAAGAFIGRASLSVPGADVELRFRRAPADATQSSPGTLTPEQLQHLKDLGYLGDG